MELFDESRYGAGACRKTKALLTLKMRRSALHHEVMRKIDLEAFKLD